MKDVRTLDKIVNNPAEGKKTDHTVGIAIAAPSARATQLHAPLLEAAFRKQLASSDREFVLDVEFQAAPGFNILFGASGAGKTTLLDCIAGLTTPDSGRIAIAERVLYDRAKGINLPVAKRRVGYVFQNLALFPHLTVAQNLQFGLAHLSKSERNDRTAAMLQSFRISHLAQRSARKISGGESQRVALARTLVTDPSVLLLDEPLAALDAPTKAKIIDDLRKWNEAHRIPILYVTHSREEVFALGERVLVLDAGRLIAQGTPHEVLSAPRMETVAQLAGFENIFDAVVESIRPERGTMVCRIISPEIPKGTAGKGTASAVPPAAARLSALAAGEMSNAKADSSPRDKYAHVVLETPLVRGGVGSEFRVGIRAGDILLATSAPVGISARNVLPGRITSIEQRDVMIVAHVNCRVEMKVHLTLAARDSLELEAGKEVWLVIKTHSCHLMRG
jgi:molybdenum ABC transporter ATP-binding protein